MDIRRLALLHLTATAAMVGLMTMVQLVVYPQYDLVPAAEFSEYVEQHGIRIGIPLALFAPAEVVLALLLWLRAPAGRLRTVAFVAGALLAVAWVATGFWYGPLHGDLIGRDYDPDRIDLLADTNWFRTIAWWIRGGLAVWFAFALTSGPAPAASVEAQPAAG
ncbi:MAG: hypothetical protein AAF962_20545 [Actinomycetota bacterium]